MCVLLIWGFIKLPLEINQDIECTTWKHQNRLRCRWTLYPFITHALNLLAVIWLATGDGVCGHLTSCSLSLLWQMAKHIYFSQSISLVIPPSLNALYKSSFPGLCPFVPHPSASISLPRCLSLCPILPYIHTHIYMHTLTHRTTRTHKFMCKDGIWVPWQQGTSKSN